jgi:hypothetical protein
VPNGDFVLWEDVRPYVEGCQAACIRNPAGLNELVFRAGAATTMLLAEGSYHPIPLTARRLRNALHGVLSSPKDPEPDKQSADTASAAEPTP